VGGEGGEEHARGSVIWHARALFSSRQKRRLSPSLLLYQRLSPVPLPSLPINLNSLIADLLIAWGKHRKA
jgi:hypothetical protein